MARFVIRRLAIFPLVLLLANFLGFAYAYYLGPIQAARNPYGVIGGKLEPILPQYIEYLKSALQLNFGTMPQGEPIATMLVRTCLVSLGLLSLALIGSIVVGVPLGLNAVRSTPPKVSPWLTAIVTVGLASPSYYIGILLIAASVLYVIWGPGSDPIFPFQGYGWDMHLVLPTLALMFLPTVKIAQITSGRAPGNELSRRSSVAYPIDYKPITITDTTADHPPGGTESIQLLYRGEGWILSPNRTETAIKLGNPQVRAASNEGSTAYARAGGRDGQADDSARPHKPGEG